MSWVAIVLVLPMFGLAATLFLPLRTAAWAPVVVTAGNLIITGCVLILQPHPVHSLASSTGSWLFDPLSLGITAITLVVGFTAALYSVGYVRTHASEVDTPPGNQRRYFALLLTFYISLLGVPLLQNVFFTWGAIELTALSSVLLVDWNDTPLTHEATWKYLVIMTVGGLIALFGLVLFVGSAQVPFSGATWSNFSDMATTVPPVILRVSFVLVLSGFGAKAGLVPFNFWLPDAHSQAPSPVSAMLSGIKLNCAMYGILRLQSVLHAGGQARFADLALGVIGFLTIIVSALMTVSQTDYKRLFAYSSAENLGLVAVAFAFGPLGMVAGYLQMANHALIKSMLFYQSGELLHLWGSTDMRGLSGLSGVFPRTGHSLMFGMLAIAGAPPFGLFISEFLIIFAIVKHGAPWLAGLLLLSLVILFGNFLRYAIQIGYGAPSSRLQVVHRQREREGVALLVPTALHLSLTIVLGTAIPFLIDGLMHSSLLS